MQRSVKGRFSVRGPAARFAPQAIGKALAGYSRWLGFNRYHGWLDPALGVMNRVTETRVAAYFDELQTLGNRDYTILGRFQELQMALRLMVPGADVGWLTRPGGVPLRRRLAMEKRVLRIHDSSALYDWGLELMEQAVTLTAPNLRQVMLRDGLLICLLAAVGLRLRSVELMRLGQQLRFDSKEWWITLDRPDLKARSSQDQPLPASLTPWLDRYVAVERQELLAGRSCDAVWVRTGGAPLTQGGLHARIRWRSRERFGRAHSFGVHRFRHCIGTTLPLMFPDQPGLATSVLNISAGVHAKHYDRGLRASSARGYLAGLDEDRKEARALLGRGAANRNPKQADE
ncbi:tyrosine-type recombinase/integrase [Belnapia sp. T18]|uniref:Tyrosine-type recombinase/integrase n=1 Tax=Belnapia arida TaxID=2804533 RepID=A0ABS1UDQ3_9PROT|nr:tyrosine-type recombinase/integrase [Belnapia arida]MBL6081802.1 tyrosine-type recombinase/integrase [Belnapia arida]